MANTMEIIEGFDNMVAADVPLCYLMNQNPTIVAGVVEGNAITINNGNWIAVTVPTNASYYVGAHVWCSGSGGTFPNGTILQFMEGTTVHGFLSVNTDGTLSISRTGGTPAVSSAFGPWLPTVAYFVEVYYKVDNSAGAWEVRVNGNTVIGPTGSLDTNNAGAVGTINTVRWIGATQFTLNIDNCYFASGTAGFQDEGRVVTDLPTADGTNTAWTASAGTDVSTVDETNQNGDTDYISSSTASQIDTFTMATLGVTGTIRAVAIRIFGRKDDAAARNVATHIRRAATEYDNGTTHALTSVTNGYQGIWPTDPNTGVAWVDSNIDGAEYGVKNI